MKKIKMLSLVLAMALCCSMLTGCMGAIAEVEVNADGSGTVALSAGMTKESLEMMASMDESGEAFDLSEYTPFVYNGVTYYGAVESAPFSSVEEFNEAMSDEVMEESTNGVDSGSVTLSQNKDGSFNLTIVATPETGDTTELKESATTEGSEVDPAMVEELLKDFAIVYKFKFPNDVKQIQGPTAGITITGNELVMDMMKLGEIKETTTYLFTTSDEKISSPVFVDVQPNAWYYNAVMAMAEGGLVAGVGNNKFNPEGTLTYAQFCTILARAKMLDTTSENGYWAYGSIKSCIQAGYIVDRGEITSANYDVAIPREAAVAAMYKGKQAELFLPTNTLTATDIPDYDKISDVYKNDILNAYKYGITAGMDANRTFNPQGQLTRAQVCQLFYNLDWTAPLANVGGSSSN